MATQEIHFHSYPPKKSERKSLSANKYEIAELKLKAKTESFM
jgi:hypothetical protein